MLHPLRRHRLADWFQPPAETSRLTVGSTGSGKSEGELVELVRLARQRQHAVVLLDGHGPLAFRAAGHWAARGFEGRMVYEPLRVTDRTLCWTMLPKSVAPTPSQRRLEDAETRDEIAQCFLAQRNLATLNDRPWTKEWLEAAIALCLAQEQPEPLDSLAHAFRVGSAEYERLLGSCGLPEVARKFRDLERLWRKNPVQYETLTGASRRLVEPVCTSEAVRLRSRPGPFEWLPALRRRALVVIDGGGLRSGELKRTIFLLVSLQVIHAVRRHFAETQRPLPVVLVLEEAGAFGLVTPFVRSALQELRKAGLSIHLITQSCLDFGDPSLFETVLANSPWQAWYQVLSPADQGLGAKALVNATFDPFSVHFTRKRPFPEGNHPVPTESRVETADERGNILRRERRTGVSYLTRYRRVTDAYYKSPQLQEQEFRTGLATLRVGERFVRDRRGVRRERVTPVRPPWFRRITDASTLAAIDRIRRQPIYLECPTPDPAPPAETPQDAAARLRALAGDG